MNFIGLLRTLERIARPAGHDDDRPLDADASQLAAEVCRVHGSKLCLVCDGYDDALWVHPRDLGAEQLAEREAEEEVSEPRQCQTHPRTGWKLRTPGSATPHKVCNMCDSPIPGTDYNYCDYHRGAVFADFADTPNSTESSPLSWTGPPSPLNKGQGPSCRILAPHYVTPTGMDHQCYCGRPQDHSLDDFGHRPHICPCGQLWADLPTKSSASNHAGTGAEPTAPADLHTAGSGPSEVSGHSPVPPSEGRPTSELLTEAARIIGNLSQYTVEYFYRDLMHELRDRAATFKAIEE